MNKMLETKELLAGVSLIPESAPFNQEQRSWLNGFFAGMTGIEEIMADRSGQSQSTATGIIEEAAEVEEDFPWHDDTLSIQERLDLAQGKPPARQLMAAMAQLDCGSCGYLCQSYAEAIDSGEETNLTLCTPGGKETAKAVKKLVKLNSGSEKTKTITTGAAQPNQPPGYSRKSPVAAKLIKSEKLTGEGSAKDVRHVEIDLSENPVKYEVGDALGVFPTNCQELAAEIVSHCANVDNREQALEQLLTLDLAGVTDELCDLYAAKITEDIDRQRLNALVDDEDQIEEFDVLDFLQMFSNIKPSFEQFAECLPPMSPRLYSIASSLKAHPGQVHLTVGKVTYEKKSRLRKGVASTLLAERVSPGSRLNVFVHKSHGFSVPSDDSCPMIMVGPGTGIAPFISFLQERDARNATGENWLFFGDQKSETDFLYRQDLNAWKKRRLLNRLDTAFSRDQADKIYVQDRMRESAGELFQWLERGAHFFVCGDASRMAKDVDKALHEIVQQQGAMSAEQAKAYIKRMKDELRYCRDVY